MKKNNILQAFVAAFPQTLPVLAGYFFLGFAYGVYMHSSGFSFLYPMLMAITIYGGSLEFVCVTMLLSSFAPLQTFVMAFIIQARHLFYGISMLDKYKGLGWKKPYAIFALSDETFSVNYSATIPSNVDKGWFYFFVSILDQSYWILGATLGGVLGAVLPFNTQGIEFVMTAMFVVIFMNQWEKDKKHASSYIGFFCAIGALLLFGAESFMLPTMVFVLALLTIFRRPIERGYTFL